MKIVESRNKREGRYKGKRYGRHFHSATALCNFMRSKYPNPWDHIAAGFAKRPQQ